MKVALVAEWLDAWRGGAETSTMQFIHRLLDRGVELHVFTRSRPSPTPGLHVHTLRGASMSRTRRSVTFAHRTERQVRDDSFDIIHAISPCRGADLYQPRGGTVAETIERNLALLPSSPVRFLKKYANHFNLKQRYTLALERALFTDRSGPVVVALSDYVVRQLKERYGVPDERIRKIYNGVDPSGLTDQQQADHRRAIRGDLGIGEADCLVLLIAHNFRLKGVQRWMEAASILARRGLGDIRSVVIGQGDSQRWHRLAARMGIADALTFTGPSDRVEAFLAAGDVLVHPTYYDPCSRVVLEAMVAGLPCITTRWDGAAEMIEDEVSGYVLDHPQEVVALADRVDRLRDSDRRRQIGAAARRITPRVGMARHADEMLALYEELAGRRDRR